MSEEKTFNAEKHTTLMERVKEILVQLAASENVADKEVAKTLMAELDKVNGLSTIAMKAKALYFRTMQDLNKGLAEFEEKIEEVAKEKGL